MLHWIKDKNIVFQHIQQSLKTGGMFGFVSSCNFDPVKTFFTPTDIYSPDVIQVFTNKHYIISTEEFQKLLLANNFKVVHLEESSVKFQFSDIHKLIEFFIIHARGQLDETCFDSKAMERCYENKEMAFETPVIIAVVIKT